MGRRRHADEQLRCILDTVLTSTWPRSEWLDPLESHDSSQVLRREEDAPERNRRRVVPPAQRREVLHAQVGRARRRRRPPRGPRVRTVLVVLWSARHRQDRAGRGRVRDESVHDLGLGRHRGVRPRWRIHPDPRWILVGRRPAHQGSRGGQGPPHRRGRPHRPQGPVRGLWPDGWSS